MGQTTSHFTLRDWVFFGFFLSHIPISLLVDAQALLPACFFPSAARSLVQSYAHAFKDPFMGAANPPEWFKSFILLELLVQVPFFAVIVSKMRNGKGRELRVPGMAYAAHVCTTVAPILAEVLFKEFPEGALAPRTLPDRLALVGIYAPYFLIPMWFGIHLYRNQNPFVPAEDEGVKKKKTG